MDYHRCTGILAVEPIRLLERKVIVTTFGKHCSLYDNMYVNENNTCTRVEKSGYYQVSIYIS